MGSHLLCRCRPFRWDVWNWWWNREGATHAGDGHSPRSCSCDDCHNDCFHICSSLCDVCFIWDASLRLWDPHVLSWIFHDTYWAMWSQHNHEEEQTSIIDCFEYRICGCIQYS